MTVSCKCSSRCERSQVLLRVRSSANSVVEEGREPGRTSYRQVVCDDYSEQGWNFASEDHGQGRDVSQSKLVSQITKYR